MLAGRPKVAADKVRHRVSPRPAEVGHEASGLAERELHEPIGDLARVDRLEPEAGRDGDHRQPGHARGREGQVMHLRRPQGRPGEARAGHDPLRRGLGGEVAEHGPVEAALTGTRSAPTTEMYTRCRTPAWLAASTRRWRLDVVSLRAAAR